MSLEEGLPRTVYLVNLPHGDPLLHQNQVEKLRVLSLKFALVWSLEKGHTEAIGSGKVLGAR